MGDELEKCNEVDNVTVNIQLLDAASAEEQAQPGFVRRRRFALGDICTRRRRAWSRFPILTRCCRSTT